MRRVLGYIDGKPQWSENEPAYGGSPKLGGSMVVGGPGPVELQRMMAKAHAEKKRLEKVP